MISLGQAKLDAHISIACKTFSAEDFAHILELVIDDLSKWDQNTQDDCACLVHLSTVFLRNAPEGTLKRIQGFVSQCLESFATGSVFSSGSLNLRLRVLEFLSLQCTDRVRGFCTTFV